VNVFGARNYHPILQSSLIESYYVSFYVSINIGALAGILLIPIIAQQNVTVAYFTPFVILSIAVAIFAAGTPRYVRSQPRGDLFKKGTSPGAGGGGKTISLLTIFRITLLIVPFCIAYSQMPTTFIVQGTVMHKAFGFVDAATMNGLDAAAVLVFGYLTGNHLYPALAERGIKIPTTYKFAIGSTLASLAILWALFVEHRIHATYESTNGKVNVMWQAPSYLLIGWGEIFAVSAAYEAAFSASPPEKKVLASAVNIFCIGGIPNVLCILLYRSCREWFISERSGDANITRIENYASARVGNYFWVLFAILVSGVLLNVHPKVRRFVESVEDTAAELIRTPVLRKTPPVGQRRMRTGADEESPLISASKQQQQYLKYGRGPVLYRLGSMRAGPSLSRRDLKGAKLKQHIKYKYIPKMYRGADGAGSSSPRPPGTPPTSGGGRQLQPSVLSGPQGNPIRAGALTGAVQTRPVIGGAPLARYDSS